MAVNLTARQQAIVDYVTDYHQAHHCSPTSREVAEHFGIAPTASANHLKAIVKKGAMVKIVSATGQARGWRVP